MPTANIVEGSILARRVQENDLRPVDGYLLQHARERPALPASGSSKDGAVAPEELFRSNLDMSIPRAPYRTQVKRERPGALVLGEYPHMYGMEIVSH